MTDSIELLRELRGCLSAPASLKSGEYLANRVGSVVRNAMSRGERSAVVDVMRSWLRQGGAPESDLAITVAHDEQLSELRPDLQSLREDIVRGAVLKPYYLRWVDEALAALDSEDEGH